MKMLYFFLACLVSASCWAIKLSDYRPYKFEVLFTNPLCENYFYQRPLITESGKSVESKPKNVYCKPSDEAASVARENSPQYRMIEWISDRNTKEISLAYLSFNSKNVANALCSALQRGVKVSMVLDGGTDAQNPHVSKDAENLKRCGSSQLFQVIYRGNTGGLGFAHNKIMLINPGQTPTKILFSSGNLTGGTSINHENWNFVTTSGESYFAQAHQCVIGAMIEAGESKQNFTKKLNQCRSQIKSEQESDIQVYFSPVDGARAFAQVSEAAKRATLIEAMSHRFSGQLAELYSSLLADKKSIKFILDDDIYWSAKLRQDIGRNTSIEAYKIYRELINQGMETRFLQTNQNVYQLQHNKFMIFSFEKYGAVFNGAGNFTTSAFTKNFENFYYITINEVVETYKKQFDYYFYQMATAPQDMPRDYILP